MIKVEVKDGNIERALKILKRKFANTKVVRELRDRQEYTKPSVYRRNMMQRAKYANRFKLDD